MKFIALLLVVNSAFCQLETDDVLEFIKNAGYSGEAHQVETVDGYLLKVHRVLPKGNVTQKHPVFLMHGLIATSADFVISGPKIALAYYLADNGFDVYLGNARGNKHSTNHKSLSIESKEFWTFSWHEIGMYDVPAMIDFVLNKTETSRLFYIGHSQGTTSLMVLLSNRPEYNEKIIQGHFLTPAAFMEYSSNPSFLILKNAAKNGLFRGFRYLRLSIFWDIINDKFCSQKQSKVKFAICKASLFAVIGPNKNEIIIDDKIFEDLVNHLAPRISVMQLVHYFQSLDSAKFRTFDHSWPGFEVENFTKPVDYNLTNVKIPVFVYAGTQDAVVGIPDVERLIKILPNVKRYQVYKDWNHVDFTYGKPARQLVYKLILQDIQTSGD